MTGASGRRNSTRTASLEAVQMRDLGLTLFFGLARKPSAVTLLAGAMLLCGSTGSAQQSFGSISGVVQDGQGAVIPSAKVELTNTAQGAVAREVTTSAEGTFVITPLPPATYSLSVEALGFKKYVKNEIELFAQDRIGLPPIVLEIGLAGEAVTVEASVAQLQTVSAERSGVLTGSQIMDLA